MLYHESVVAHLSQTPPPPTALHIVAGNGIQLGSSEQAQTAPAGLSALGEDKSPASLHRVVEHETAER